MKSIKMLFLAGLICAPTFLTGCATYVCGTSQTIPVTSKPQRAQVTVYNEFKDVLFEGTTPCNVELPRRAAGGSAGFYRIVLSREGYLPTEVVLKGHLNRAFFGNIVTAGLGAVVDSATGAMWALTPTEVRADLSEETTASPTPAPVAAPAPASKDNSHPAPVNSSGLAGTSP